MGRIVRSKAVVGLLLVALLTVPTLITVNLKEAGENAVEAASNLKSYAIDIRIQDGVRWRLISGAMKPEEARKELLEARHQAGEHLRDSVRLGMPAATAAGVTRLTQAFTQAVDREVQLLSSGQQSDAKALDEGQGALAFVQLDELLALETARLANQAQVGQRYGTIGVLLSVLLSLILLSVLQTVRKRGENSRTKRQIEVRYRALIDHSADLVAVVDRQGCATLVSPSVERLLARPEESRATAADVPAEAGSLDFIHALDLRDRERFSTVLRAAAPGRMSGGEFRLSGPAGAAIYEVLVQDLSADPSVEGLVLTAHDVTDRLVLQQEMEHRALHDELTGLPNRALLADRFEQALLGAERAGASVGLLLLDLDRFKEVNDTFGHHYGDELLRQIGPRLTAVLRGVDTIVRLGGDEFAVLLQDVHGEDDAIEVATALLTALSTPFHVEGVDLDVEASIGVVVSGKHGQDPVTLMQHADIAMYIAKGQHLGVFAYDPSVDGHSATKLAMIGDLRRGLQRGELVLYYQPKVNITTGDLVGAEALVRWQHPEHGLVFPDEFIPLAERTGLINPLTRHILDMAMAQAHVWLDEGRPLPIAVNLSARNLHNERFAAQVAELLAVHDVPAHLLELEVTESAIMIDPVRACQMLEKLAGLGIRLALDDFGAGYTSLSQLKTLPINEIKIDRSFVTAMVEDPRDSLIVQSVIALGHNLGLALVAEGVETEETLTALAGFGCDVFQGYYTTRPVPVAEFDTWSVGRRITTVGSVPTAHLVARPGVVTDRATPSSGGLAQDLDNQSDHVVFFFDDRQELLHEVIRYVNDGLHNNGHVVIVVSAENRQSLRAALSQRRLKRAESEGRFLALDAEQTLAEFMVGPLPDPALFKQRLGNTVRAHLIETGVLSVYSEMAAVLCNKGNILGALKLEELYNELQLTSSFSIFCAHPLAPVPAQPEDALAQISDRHTHAHLSHSLDQDAKTATQARIVMRATR